MAINLLYNIEKSVDNPTTGTNSFNGAYIGAFQDTEDIPTLKSLSSLRYPIKIKYSSQIHEDTDPIGIINQLINNVSTDDLSNVNIISGRNVLKNIMNCFLYDYNDPNEKYFHPSSFSFKAEIINEKIIFTRFQRDEVPEGFGIPFERALCENYGGKYHRIVKYDINDIKFLVSCETDCIETITNGDETITNSIELRTNVIKRNKRTNAPYPFVDYRKFWTQLILGCTSKIIIAGISNSSGTNFNGYSNETEGFIQKNDLKTFTLDDIINTLNKNKRVITFKKFTSFLKYLLKKLPTSGVFVINYNGSGEFKIETNSTATNCLNNDNKEKIINCTNNNNTTTTTTNNTIDNEIDNVSTVFNKIVINNEK